MSILTELNEQAEKVCKALLEAKRATKEAEAARDPLKAAYHAGRREELEKWLASVEGFITQRLERNENRCILCGDIIPEGRQVCPNCNYKSNEREAHK